MIHNQWYVILESKEVAKNKAISILRLGEKMVVWRNSLGEVGCIADRCCHRGASLGCGKVVSDEIECPFHGFRYDKTGKVTLIPANGKNASVEERYQVRSYYVKEQNGFIWLWWGDKREYYPEIEFFEDLKEGFSYSTFADYWPVHYSRAIENQLDVVHLPFVHKTTIGRGNKTLVNGPVVIVEGDLLKFFVKNQEDDGKTKPQKSKEIVDYISYPQLNFRFPNIWHNIISDKVRIFAAFVPIDEENTVVYIRFYQKFMKLPFLSGIVNFLGSQLNKIILGQDKRVVVTQRPVKSTLKMDEQLVQGDLPIIQYRKHREELLASNSLIGNIKN